MTKYQFDFSKFTIGDNDFFSHHRDIGPIWYIVDRVTIGGACNRPANEGPELWRQFVEAYEVFMASPPAIDADDAVRDMLEGVEGL